MKSRALRSFKMRPHHLLCANGFEGKGYSSAFVAGFAEIVAHLRRPGGAQTPLHIVQEADDICHPCPYRQGTGCATQEKITRLDQAHGRALGLKAGHVLTWQEAQQRLVERVSETVFEEICHGCEWQKEGICLQALRRLRQTWDTQDQQEGQVQHDQTWNTQEEHGKQEGLGQQRQQAKQEQQGKQAEQEQQGCVL